MKIRKVKRRIALFLVFMMCFSTLNMTVVAAEQEKMLKCGEEEHAHDGNCYKEKLTCDKDEHKHSSTSCYKYELTCDEDHEHDDSCKEEILACKKAEHSHNGGCYKEERVCGKTEHKHTAACYEYVTLEKDSNEPENEEKRETSEKVELPTSDFPSDKSDKKDEADETDKSDNQSDTGKKTMPEVVKRFLDAVQKLVNLGAPTEDNAERFNALGQKAMDAYEAVQDAGLEDYEGVQEALVILMGIVDGVTGGAETTALISGESFTVRVVKVVNGVAVDTKTLTSKCLQSTKHSGYNHSTNLRTLANQSGFSGYIGYNWSQYTTVPSSYTRGLCPNNNYTSAHYNITGSAPYKANETLFLFFESSKTYTLNYNANGGTGAPAQQTATSTASSYNFTVSYIQPVRAGYDFLGWTTSSTATTPDYYGGSTIAVSGTTTLYAVWEKDSPAPEPDPEPEKVTATWKDGYTDTPIKVEEVDKDISDEELDELYPEDPTRDGYTFAGWTEPEVDEDGNITITAKWEPIETPDPTPDPDPTPTPDPDPTPNPDPTPDPDPTPTPDPDPNPDATLTPDPTPTPTVTPEPAPAPTVTPEPAPAPTGTPALTPVVTLAATPTPELTPTVVPTVEVADETVPLANQNNEAGETMQRITDGDVPLARGEGYWALINFALMNLAIFESFMLLIGYFIHTKNDNDKEEEKRKLKKKGIFRILSLPVAVISLIAFILTEDIHLQTALVDDYTIYMLAIAIVQTVVVALSNKKYVEEEEERELEMQKA